MSRAIVAAVAAALGLAACSTLKEVGGETALSGQQLDAALGLYGPYSQFMQIDGKPTYVWRRHYTADAQDYYCELRIETGYRRTISASVMQGYPQACRLFSVRYSAHTNAGG
jgi:hypothetical protein